MEHTENNTDKSKFNMSQLILMSIHEMKRIAAEKYRKGDVRGWYFEWVNIKIEILGELKGNPKKERLEKLEKAIENRLRVPSMSVKYIKQYIEEIQILIKKKHIGLVNQEDRKQFA